MTILPKVSKVGVEGNPSKVDNISPTNVTSHKPKYSIQQPLILFEVGRPASDVNLKDRKLIQNMSNFGTQLMHQIRLSIVNLVLGLNFIEERELLTKCSNTIRDPNLYLSDKLPHVKAFLAPMPVPVPVSDTNITQDINPVLDPTHNPVNATDLVPSTKPHTDKSQKKASRQRTKVVGVNPDVIIPPVIVPVSESISEQPTIAPSPSTEPTILPIVPETE